MTGILSLITFAPMIGVAAILALRAMSAGQDTAVVANRAKIVALVTSLVTLALSVFLVSKFDAKDTGFWIRTRRQKTGGRANIPLLDIPMSIIRNYCQLELLDAEDPILPILSNQKMNAYLKELADLCNIQKQLSYHVARHTFATTVTMMNGVPIETVSKMLGHKNIHSTQHYARIVDKKVGDDMKLLAAKLNGSTAIHFNNTNVESITVI